jgi:hypothetical protein
MQVFFESDLINPAQYKVRLFIDAAQKPSHPSFPISYQYLHQYHTL